MSYRRLEDKELSNFLKDGNIPEGLSMASISVVDLLLFLEKHKASGATPNDMKQILSKITNNSEKVWIEDFKPEHILSALEDSSFIDLFTNQQMNPYKIISYIMDYYETN